MRQRFIVVVLLVTSMGAITQENPSKPTVSDAPITSEQIAVYRAVLAAYLKGSNGVLNLANITDPLDRADTGCLTVAAGAAKGPATVVHRIGPSLVTGTKIILVDPDRQQETIKENDPQNLIKKTIDDGQKFTDEQLDQSLKSAFDTGLFTLSEIVFDKEHRRAAVSYSFVCGSLCGNGTTLVLKKVGPNWKVAKRCSGWIS